MRKKVEMNAGQWMGATARTGNALVACALKVSRTVFVRITYFKRYFKTPTAHDGIALCSSESPIYPRTLFLLHPDGDGNDANWFDAAWEIGIAVLAALVTGTGVVLSKLAWNRCRNRRAFQEQSVPSGGRTRPPQDDLSPVRAIPPPAYVPERHTALGSNVGPDM